jgi:O-antigen/teichoic acid export membrane protein
MLIKQTFCTLLIKLLSMMISFFVGIYIVKTLPVGQYGIYSLLLSIVSISVMVFTFNVHELLFVRLTIEKSRLAISKMISTTNTVVFFIYFIIIMVVLYSPFKDIVVNVFNMGDTVEAFEYTIFYIFFYSFVLTFLRYLMFSGQPVKYSIFEMLIATLWAFFFVIYGSLNVTEIMQFRMNAIILLSLTLFVLFNKQNGSIGIFTNFDKKYFREAFVFGLATFIPSTCLYLLSVIDIALLSYLDSNESVGFFAFASMPFNMLVSVFTGVLILVMLPKINKYHLNRKSRKYLLISRVFQLFLICLLPIIITLVFYSDEVILILSKPKYLQVSDTYVFLSIVVFLSILSAFLKQDLYLDRRYKELLIVFVPAVLINVILNIYLIELFSYVGSIYALTVTYLYIFSSLAIVVKIHKKLLIRYKRVAHILIANLFFFASIYLIEYCASLLSFNNNFVKLSVSLPISLFIYMYIIYKNNFLKGF